MLSLLKYEYSEIEEAKLKESEEEELKETYEVIKNAEKISESLNNAQNIIDGEVLGRLDEVSRNMSKISTLSEKYERIYNSLQDSYYVLEDALSEISNEVSSLDFDEEECTNVLKRLDLISKLKRKYGNSVEEIIKYKDEIKEKIEQIENVDEINNKLKSRLKIVEENMYSIALKMNKVRIEKAQELEEKININFKELEMSSAKIKIEINMSQKREFNSNGLDRVCFLICTNKGEEFKSLTKIASGGEISRIVLAIKSILSNEDKVESCVFDEIDTGISGKAANSVGSKIREIAKNHQVICVTHLPPVAANADYHYYISKSSTDNKTKTEIKLLTSEESINELARISAGNITEAAVKYAIELKKVASKCVA